MGTPAKNIRVGDRLQSNDPRENGKIVVVLAVYRDPKDNRPYAIYQAGVRKAKVRLDRIFTDQKKRKNGYNLVLPTV